MQQRDSQDRVRETESHPNLDNRYGKIGISAVAAAVCHQGEPQRAPRESRAPGYDRD